MAREGIRLPPEHARWLPLSKDHVERIAVDSLRVLDEVGVYIDNDKILQVAKDNGCSINNDKKIVYFPENVVKEFIRKAPREIVLAGREQDDDIVIHEISKKAYGCFSSPMPQVCVWNEGEGEYIYRHVKDADLPEITRLYDALATVDLIFPPTIALETAKQGLPAHIHELFATLSETTKHVNLTNAAPRSLDEWDYYVRLAAEVVGGEEELRRKPIISGKSLFTPPLRLSKPACFNLLGAAKYGLPLMIGGCNTPLTILNACNTVVNHASVVANLAFAQMLRPKMPCVVDVSGDSLHLIHITTNKTAPENLLLNAALIQMAHDHLGLPVCNGPYQSAKITDIQASFEASVATCSLWMLGCDFWVNYTFNDYAFNVEMLVFYDELARYFDHLGKRFIDTIPTDENVAFGAIKEVGPLADYLTHSITLKNANLQYKPELADYRDFTKWKKDKKNMLDRIREKVRILEMHRAPTLPGDVSRRMLMIVNEADRKLSRN